MLVEKKWLLWRTFIERIYYAGGSFKWWKLKDRRVWKTQASIMFN
jgi:hypothetical protein